MADGPLTPKSREAERSRARQAQRERSIGRFLLVGGTSVLAARIAGMGAGTATHMLLARLLPPEQLAAYFLTLSVVEVGAHLSHLGMPRPLTRFIASARSDRPGQARGVLAAALPLWLGASVVVALVYVGGLGGWLAEAAFESPIMATGTALAAAWLVFQACGDLLAGALSGFRRVGLAAWVAGTLARVVTAGVLLVWLVTRGHAEFTSVVALVAAAAALGPTVALFALRREVADLATERVPRRVLMASALPLLVTGMVHMGYMRADLWTVGVLFDANQVALYGAAKRLIILISLPLVILNLVVPPIVAELHAKNDERLQGALRGAATLAGLPAIAVLAVFALASETVLGVAFGSFFREAGVVLTILSLERLLFVWVGPCGMVLAMTGNEQLLMRITLVSGVVTVTAIAIGAQLAGVVGVAIGYAVGSGGQQLATWVAARATTGFRTDIDVRHLGFALDALRRALRA